MDSNPPPYRPCGVLLSGDLIFNSKITGTARELGHSILVASQPAQAKTMLEQKRPKVVFVDLSAGDLARPEAIAQYRATVPEAAFVAFGSHVDTEALDSARAAGCEPVLPRSRFTMELPELIERFLGANRA